MMRADRTRPPHDGARRRRRAAAADPQRRIPGGLPAEAGRARRGFRDEPDPDPRGARAARERRLRPDPAASRRAGLGAVARRRSASSSSCARCSSPGSCACPRPASRPRTTRRSTRINAEYRAEIRAMNPARWGELNTRLHLRLMSRAEQPRTLAIVTALLQNTDRYTRLQLSLTGSGRDARREGARGDGAAVPRRRRGGGVQAPRPRTSAHAEAMLVAFIRKRAPAASVSSGRMKFGPPEPPSRQRRQHALPRERHRAQARRRPRRRPRWRAPPAPASPPPRRRRAAARCGRSTRSIRISGTSGNAQDRIARPVDARHARAVERDLLVAACATASAGCCPRSARAARRD